MGNFVTNIKTMVTRVIKAFKQNNTQVMQEDINKWNSIWNIQNRKLYLYLCAVIKELLIESKMLSSIKNFLAKQYFLALKKKKRYKWTKL